jgi:high-affinity K+ transport system ATPase subunit B
VILPRASLEYTWCQRLELKYDTLRSNFPSNFNLRPYNMARNPVPFIVDFGEAVTTLEAAAARLTVAFVAHNATAADVYAAAALLGVTLANDTGADSVGQCRSRLADSIFWVKESVRIRPSTESVRIPNPFL